MKGQGIYAYVTLHEGTEYKDSLRKELIQTVREQIGAFAAPDVIHWAPGESAIWIGLRLRAPPVHLSVGLDRHFAAWHADLRTMTWRVGPLHRAKTEQNDVAVMTGCT